MPRPIDPLSLQLFVAVCEEGSIARAAGRQAMVPSALSKRMAALEDELGVTLLLRRRGGVQPTAAGQALLTRAREALLALDRARAELGEYRLGVQASVRVLASPSALAEALPEDIASFMARSPEVQLSLDERLSDDIVTSLREGTADLGVLSGGADAQGLELLPYRSDHLCVAMAPSHALARRPSLRFAEVVGLATVGVVARGLVGTTLRRQAALLGHTLVHRLQVSSIDAACRLVAAGLGLAVLPREVAVPHAGAGRLALVRLDEPWAERRFHIALRPEALPSPTARALAAHLSASAGG